MSSKYGASSSASTPQQKLIIAFAACGVTSLRVHPSLVLSKKESPWYIFKQLSYSHALTCSKSNSRVRICKHRDNEFDNFAYFKLQDLAKT
ncbi:hypothetical protein AG1IA_08410 [Rhizoctonia solani AG-1 IA]|uniref:Uncharacterized protein n=1 Tax=Thanatephorus cucumeris (strain AG1-IA) TaxID=983506 RepID=L8WH60_THACA|nr:hypothetical protein AG1IA_08410 [Rhizoctonia solani AG-1 IA]